MDQTRDVASSETARAAADALSRGDFVALRELLAEDVVWHANGDPARPATYRGRDEVIAALRVQRAHGVIETSNLTEIEEPEVETFGMAAFGGLGSNYYSLNATSRAECADTMSVMQVNGPVITTFGSIPAPRTY